MTAFMPKFVGPFIARALVGASLLVAAAAPAAATKIDRVVSVVFHEIFLRCVIGPEDDYRFPDNVLARYKTPIPAVL